MAYRTCRNTSFTPQTSVVTLRKRTLAALFSLSFFPVIQACMDELDLRDYYNEDQGEAPFVIPSVFTPRYKRAFFPLPTSRRLANHKTSVSISLRLGALSGVA